MNGRRQLPRLLLVAVIVAAVVAYFALGLGQYLNLDALKHQQQALATWRSAHPWQLASLFFTAYVLVAALSIPGAAIMTLAGGAIFGFVEGLVLVSFASAIGATLAMLLSRYVLRDWVRGRFGQRLKKIDAGIERDGGFYLFSIRLVPIFPFFLVNLLMGLTAIRAWNFYWVSQLGMLAGTVVYVNAGTQLADIESLSGLLSPGLIGSFVLLALLPWLSKALLAWIKARRVYRGWDRPRHFDRNLVVIGAGAGGLVSAYIAATVRARVTLVEKHKMGGDCLNYGCVPSKALIRIAHAAHEARHGDRFGLKAHVPEVDFGAAMRSVQQSILDVAPHDSMERYQKLGVDVRRGHARITSPWCVEIDGESLTTRAIVIAAGAEPFVPPIEGLTDGPFLTSDTLWDLKTLPARLVVLGGGPIGCEMAQSFARLGSHVTQVEMAERLLLREDGDVSTLIAARLGSEGVDVRTGHKAVRIEGTGSQRQLICEHGNDEVALPFDQILVAVGRKPRTEGYGLETLDIPLNQNKTIESNDFLQTRFPNIYVCGDVSGPFQFTHASGHQAWYAAVNALFAPLKKFRADYRVMPAVTFTDPEVARVGLNQRDAREQEIDFEATRFELSELDRALAERDSEGFVEVLTAPGKDRILGATCVGQHAGEWMAELALAMKHGIGLNKILGTVHAYPTRAEANKYVAGEWKRAHAPERILGWLKRWHDWRRGKSGDAATETRKEPAA